MFAKKSNDTHADTHTYLHTPHTGKQISLISWCFFCGD